MFNSQLPTQSELPTSRQLLRSTLLALIAAGVLLVTVVMPAEYAIDPTGAGRMLGLTQMAEVKLQLAEEAAADAAAPVTPAAVEIAPETVEVNQPAVIEVVEPDTQRQKHEMSFSLAPGQGAEIKVEMLKGTQVAYFWTANGGVVNYDTHGDPYNAPREFYHGYGKGRATPEDKGVLEAAFDGHHGWFWRNRSNKPVTVTLQTEGNYIAIKRVI
ncbi:MAG: transmembrane anchor protein [Halopseudomonas yangmingensis]|uniref:Transmembrane anchor protein n=1 Tax=Halopseudomonas yangmingensis TaxID=1720063 RepID=A0A1I4U1M0_9GAMM|nr:transmembrane anchor protein [Halopseudomonas yangmingensis]SFM82825.1 hypothetical protein SAMN05216217_11717 [Halopseudomonas yangmingensis]